MNKIKHLLIFGLVFLMVLTPLASVQAASYSDVPGNYWAKEYIDKMTTEGVIQGYPDNTYKPERYVSYLEIMELLKGVKNLSKDEMESAIRDKQYLAKFYKVPSWAQESVSVALNEGILERLELKSAGEQEMLVDNADNGAYPSRAIIAVYYARALGLEPEEDHSILKYKDIQEVEDYSNPAISDANVADYLAALVKAGIFADTGSDGNFEPDRPLRRSEMAKITMLSYQYEDIESNLKTMETRLIYKSSASDNNLIFVEGSDNTTVAMLVDENAEIIIGGLESKFDDLQDDQKITIEYAEDNNPQTDYRVYKIETDDQTYGGIGNIQGLSQDKINMKFTKDIVPIKIDEEIKFDESSAFTIDEDTKIKKWGEEITANDLRLRDFVKFNATGDHLDSIQVIPSNAVVPAKIEDVKIGEDGEGSIVTAKLSDGEVYKFYASEEKFFNGGEQDLENLKKGKLYELHLNYETLSGFQMKIVKAEFEGIVVGIQNIYSDASIMLKDDDNFYPLASNVKFRGEVEGETTVEKLRHLKDSSAYVKLNLEDGKVRVIDVLSENSTPYKAAIEIVDANEKIDGGYEYEAVVRWTENKDNVPQDAHIFFVSDAELNTGSAYTITGHVYDNQKMTVQIQNDNTIYEGQIKLPEVEEE